MKIKEIVITFLKRNNFKTDGLSIYNENCKVFIMDDHYEIEFYSDALKEAVRTYTESLLISSLVGFLTWNNLLTKNYIK